MTLKKWVCFGFAMVAAAWLAGCSGTSTAAGHSDSANNSPMNLLAAKPAAKGQDRFTVLLLSSSEPDHVERANYYKKKTQELAGWNDVFIIHKEGQSELYWGEYPTLSSAQASLKKAKAYRSPAGLAPYAQAIVVPLPGTEDPGQPEWNLSAAEGEYSLLVAVFYDVPEAGYVGRKNYAVQYCKQLREEGYQAYYYHDASQSTVCIGSFPESSIRKYTTEKAERIEIVDPYIKRLQEKFTDMAVNGCQERTKVPLPNGQVQVQVVKTYLIVIPHKKASDADPLNSFGQP